MVPHMVHLQDVVKLHTFVLGDLGALLLACFGFDLRFALVVFDLGSDSIWCEGVGVGVGARGGSTWAGGNYLRGALGCERRANLMTTNKARSHTHTQAQATHPLHRGPPTPIPTAFQQGEILHSTDPFAVRPSCDTHSRQKEVSDAGHQLCGSQRGNQHLIRKARYRGRLHSDMHGPIGPVAQASRLRVPVSTQWSIRTPPTAVIETELKGCFTPPTATA